MNLIKEIAKLLGVEIGEEFKLVGRSGIYKFTETDFIHDYGSTVCSNVLRGIIRGEVKIEKLPFIPKVGDKYWSYNDIICRYIWDNTTFHKERKLLGIVFRTEQEAKDYSPIWLKRLEGEDL